MAADVVVFDPSTVAPDDAELVHDLPGGASRLVQQASGIHLVLVNGEPILNGGKLTGARPGLVLRGGSGTVHAAARSPRRPRRRR
jgi:N-acyl-D-aspartate/D-glutamate deacylase